MFNKILKSYDYSLIITYILLCLFGLIMIYSASMITAVQRYGVNSDFFYKKQLVHIVIAFALFAFTALFPYKAFLNNKFLFIMTFGMLMSLIAIFFIGHVSNNAQSWIKIGTASIQPSEFAKLVVIIYMAAVYSKKQKYMDDFNQGVAPPLLLLLIICLFVGIQPDFGTAGIIFLIGFSIVISSGVTKKNMIKLFAIGALVTLILTPFIFIVKDQIFSKERMSRIDGFLHPFQSEEDSGYHLVNSYIAIGAGGLSGEGLGKSVQKLGYLPEPHTDFIMAIISEELGVFGVAFVVGGLGYIVLKGIYVGVKCKDPFGSLLAIGISSMIGIQAFINLGGVTGLIPITGVPLPFISYGGSSLLLLSLSMGILTNVTMFVKFEEKFKVKKQETVPVQSSNRQVHRVRI
jgi:cell division protein FtsW